MKRIGSNCDYNQERNAWLRQAFKAEMALSDHIRIDDIAAKAVMRPCPRFWVSEERATYVVSAMLRGLSPLKSMLPTKRRMYQEICRRVQRKICERAHEPLYTLVFEVVNSPASEFYLSPRYARDIYTKKGGVR